MENIKKEIVEGQETDESSNPGLDADHSSDGDTVKSRYNDDNEMVSGVSEGADESHRPVHRKISSPLDEK
ncbi:MAG: hypothetical protein V4594_19210 [Bacteroidota bacterium]